MNYVDKLRDDITRAQDLEALRTIAHDLLDQHEESLASGVAVSDYEERCNKALAEVRGLKAKLSLYKEPTHLKLIRVKLSKIFRFSGGWGG